MADYAISNVPRRVVYAASGTGPYAFTFEILNQTDIAVYKASTLLTLTTDYTVTINANGTGSVTLVTSAGTSNITIVGAKNIQRTTDFTTGGDLFANTLNDELDNQTIFIQQVAETAERGLKAPVVDPTDINMTLPAKASRVGTVLAFNATTGNPEAGPSIGSVTTVAAQSANINTVATNIGSVNTVAGNITNVNTVAGISSNVSTVAGISSNVTTVAGISANVTTVASISANVTTVAGVSAGVTTVAGISADVTAVAADATDIGSVAGSIANVNTVATNIAAVNTNATNIVAIQNASTNATNAAASAVSAGNAQVAAEAARDATLAAYDNFDDRYLGSKTSNPTLDNDGNALAAGALYFNSVSGAMQVYTGSAWVAAYVSGSGFLSSANNLSDVTSTSTARTNLGLAIGTDVLAPNGSGASLTSLNADNISSGTLGVARGGTGQTTATAAFNALNPMTTTGDIIYEASATTAARLAIGTTGQVLTVVGGLPAWAAAGGGGFAAGTVLVFYQASAPTGWTKVTTQNDKALRVVSGTGGGTGGSVAFTTAFASQAVSGTVGTSGATTLSTTQIPSHTHNIWNSTFANINCGAVPGMSSSNASQGQTTSQATGGGSSHTHTGGTFTGTAINLAVQYIDVIIASKD